MNLTFVRSAGSASVAILRLSIGGRGAGRSGGVGVGGLGGLGGVGGLGGAGCGGGDTGVGFGGIFLIFSKRG